MLSRHQNIIERLNTDNEQVRAEVVSILESMGKEVVDSLIFVLMESHNKNIQFGAIDALGRIGDDEAVDAIVFSAFFDPILSSRPNTLKALIRIGERTDYENIIQFFLMYYNSEESDVYSARIMRYIGYLVTYAMYSHKRLGEISKYKSILINALYSKNTLVRSAAGSALFDVGSIRPILNALEFCKDAEIRKDASLTLNDIAYRYIMLGTGKDDIVAIRKALYRACVDDDKNVRKAAKSSLDYLASVIKFEKNNKIRKASVRNSFLKIFKDLTITEEDCGCEGGVFFSEIAQKGKIIRPLKKRIVGRCCGSDVRWGAKGDVIVRKGKFITKTVANELEKAGKEVIMVRSVIHCQAKEGICLKCFGKYNFAGDVAKVGEKIGNKAASWWARLKFNKHVIELLEARRPENPAIICEVDGCIVIYSEKSRGVKIFIGEDKVNKEYIIPRDRMIIVDVMDGAFCGQELTDGRLDPCDIFRIRGTAKLKEYILNEMLYYMPQSDFDERLIELFVKEAIKVKIINPGDSRFKKNQIVTMRESIAENSRLPRKSKHAICEPFFAGIQFK
ncbi:MAG: HEAT repeat domain-containing protein [Candidatus Omnitrophota bacterium]|nr:HEAT repeat domain-containing protein [Candidatus Omnitrophota bacterium]